MKLSRRQTRDNYDRLSRWYDLLAGSSERACWFLGLRMLDVRPGERVLDVGAGTGQALRLLSQAVGPGGRAVGVDLSTGMCRVAGSRAAKGQPPEKPPAILCGDAAELPIRASAFDAVFMSFALELFEPTDMIRVLTECARVLRSGGRLGVVAMEESREPGALERLYVSAHQRFPDWIDCRPVQVAAILAAHGFRVADVAHARMWGLPVEVAIACRR